MIVLFSADFTIRAFFSLYFFLVGDCFNCYIESQYLCMLKIDL